MAFLSNINSTVALSIAGAALAALLGASGLLWLEKRTTARLAAENAALAQSLSDEKEKNRVFTEYLEGSGGIDADNADCILRELAAPDGNLEDCGVVPGDSE